METRFCPDCQEECRADQTECRECGFPLQLVVTDDGFTCRVEASQIDRWNRIATLLRRNGIRIENRRIYWTTYQTWWVLPFLGLAIFIATLIYGPGLADSIWGPQVVVPVVNLTHQEERTPDQPRPQEPGDSGDETEFLKNALSVSERQKELNDELNISPDEYVDKVKMPFKTLAQLGRQALVEVKVRESSRAGILIGKAGLVLIERKLIEDAFVSESVNMVEEGALVRKTVFITPKANFPDSELLEATLVDEHQSSGLALIKIPITPDLEYQTNFEEELEAGQKLWVFRYTRGEYYPEPATVSETYLNNDSLVFHMVDLDLDFRYSGAPVFDEYGQLTGIYLKMDDRNLVFSMKAFRERAPILFKHLK